MSTQQTLFYFALNSIMQALGMRILITWGGGGLISVIKSSPSGPISDSMYETYRTGL